MVKYLHLASEAHSSLQLWPLSLHCQHCDRMERCSHHPGHSVYGLGLVYVLGLSWDASLSLQGPVCSLYLATLKDGPPASHPPFSGLKGGRHSKALPSTRRHGPQTSLDCQQPEEGNRTGIHFLAPGPRSIFLSDDSFPFYGQV